MRKVTGNKKFLVGSATSVILLFALLGNLSIYVFAEDIGYGYGYVSNGYFPTNDLKVCLSASDHYNAIYSTAAQKWGDETDLNISFGCWGDEIETKAEDIGSSSLLGVAVKCVEKSGWGDDCASIAKSSDYDHDADYVHCTAYLNTQAFDNDTDLGRPLFTN